MSERGCLRRYFRLPRENIAYVRFVVEAYEGLALVSSPPSRGEMEWFVPVALAEQADELARALETEAGLVSITRPQDWPDILDEGSDPQRPV